MKSTRSHFTVDDSFDKKGWVLVANRSGARLFEKKKTSFSIIKNIPHPEGKLQSHDLGSDAPGRSTTSIGSQSSFSQEVDPVEQNAKMFAAHLADILDKGRSTGRYEELFLVAEPKFLGRLRSSLPAKTLQRVKATFEKDYAKSSVQEVSDRLSELFVKH